MNLTIMYSFPKKYFGENFETIEFVNPPIIPENKQQIDIDFREFFDIETADFIDEKIEDLNLIPYKTLEVWKKNEIVIGFEYMPKKL